MKTNKSNLKEKDGYYWEFKSFYNALPEKLTVPSYTEHILNIAMTNQEIMEKWEKKPFTIEEAFAVASDIAPQVENGKWKIIYFRDADVPCRLDVWRHVDGRLNLRVYEVFLDDEWVAGGGVLVSNENSDALPSNSDSLSLETFDPLQLKISYKGKDYKLIEE